MRITQVLKKPIITEKTYKMMKMNQFVFVIDNNATKTIVKKAFEIIFDKKVDSVNLIKNKAKKKRVGRNVGKTKRIKKAIITLKVGEEFTLFDKEQQEKLKSVAKEIKSKKAGKISTSKPKISKTGIVSKFKSYWKSITTLDTTSKKEIKKNDKKD